LKSEIPPLRGGNGPIIRAFMWNNLCYNPAARLN